MKMRKLKETLVTSSISPTFPLFDSDGCLSNTQRHAFMSSSDASLSTSHPLCSKLLLSSSTSFLLLTGKQMKEGPQWEWICFFSVSVCLSCALSRWHVLVQCVYFHKVISVCVIIGPDRQKWQCWISFKSCPTGIHMLNACTENHVQ